MTELARPLEREYFGVPNADGFVPILLETLRVDSIPSFDLYNRVGNDYVLYRRGEHPFTEEQRTSLVEHRLRALYVPEDSIRAYWRYVERNIGLILADPTMPPRRKAEVFHASAIGLARDALTRQASTEKLTTAREVVRGSAQLLLEGRQGFHAFLTMVGKDANFYSHSVNVCTYGIALAQAVGLSSGELQELGMGLLLHDLGMAGVPDDVVNKPGNLSDSEWQLIRSHPTRGLQIYLDSGGKSDIAKAVILSHHERLDGTGYPQSLRDRAIPLVARIAATVNVFDALTTTRPYRPALKTYAAVLSMKRELRPAVDQRLVDLFIRVLGPGAGPGS